MVETNAKSFESTKKFPENFLLGTATGAYQVEGAWNEDKSPSVWDAFFHSNEEKQFRYLLDLPMSEIKNYQAKGIQPKLVDLYKGMGVYEVPATAVVNGTNFDYNGDIAADTYHKTDSDVQLLKELGVQVYRFSITINRIVPKVHDHFPNQAGIDYYNNLINKLIENGITPMVTLYHYDFPDSMQFLGGLANPVVHQFYLNYVRICFEKFGDRVKHWTTTSDLHLASEGYGSGHFAPGFQESTYTGFTDYIVMHHCLLTCAYAYRLYNREFREKQKGEISICIEGNWFIPQDPNNPEHVKIANIARMSTIGVKTYALAKGYYPPELVEAVNANSKKEGYKIDRITQFTKEEQELIRGSYDFVVLNYWKTIKVRPFSEEELVNEKNLKRKDRGFVMDYENITLEEVQDGFLDCLTWMNEVMDNPKIFIGENGFPEDEGVDDSVQKMTYHNVILTSLLKALDKKINVFGYCVWSFIDTLEFTFGYSKRFGIYAVDFNDENRPRTKKNSFAFFEKLFKTKTLPEIEN